MFEVGFSEIVLIFGIALIVLGPKRLPKLAADVGRWAGRARSMARQLRTQLEQEVQFDPTSTTSSYTAPTIHTPPPAAPASATAAAATAASATAVSAEAAAAALPETGETPAEPKGDDPKPA
jgi:Tat protein translocase TatB subunit